MTSDRKAPQPIGSLTWSANMDSNAFDTTQAMSQAKAAFRAGDFEDAQALCRRILEVDPDNAPTLRLFGTLAMQAGRPDAAIPIFERAIRFAPGVADAHAFLGTALLLTGRDEDGVASLKTALKTKPSHVVANLNLGLRALNAGDLDEATRYLDRALKNGRDDLDVRIAHGVLSAQKEAFETAISDFRRALDIAPGHPTVLRNLSTALIDAERYDEAMSTLETLRKQSPNDAGVSFLFGLALEGAGQPESAISQYRHALTLRPDYAEARINLGGVFRSQGQLESALECYQRVHRERPTDEHVASNLIGLLVEMKRAGDALSYVSKLKEMFPDEEIFDVFHVTTLQQFGQFGEADGIISNMLARNPRSDAAHLLKARQDGVGIDRVELEKLATQLEVDQQQSEAFANVMFALGKSMADVGDYEKSFTYYEKGNGFYKSRLKHDPNHFDTLVSEICQVFTPELFDRMRAHGSSDERVVLIVGMPRSGTTLTEQIIASHPQAFGAGELMTIPEIAGSLRKDASADDPFPKSLTSASPEELEAASRRYIEVISREAGDAKRVTDKLPGNFRFLGLAAVLFPNARVIHCRREARDSCLSTYFQQFMDSHTYAFDLYNLGRHHRAYQMLMDHWRQVLPLPILEIDYEETVGDQEGASRKLLEFCGLDWDPQVMRYYETERTVESASLWQVRQPIYDTSVERWKHYADYLEPLERGLAGRPREG